MVPEQNKNFFVTLDNSASFLVETLHTTVTQLAQAAQEEGMLVPYITSLLHQHAFTLQHIDDEQHLICGTYAIQTTKETKTLLLFSACPPQKDAFTRWEAFVTRLLTFALYHKAIGSLPLNIVWLIDVEEVHNDDETLVQWLVNNRSLLQAEGCLFDVPDDAALPSPYMALGIKGLLSIELGVETASHGQQVSYGAILPDAAWRITWALNSLKDAREEIQIVGFYETLVPMADEEIALLGSMLRDEQALERHLNVNEFLLQLHGLQLYYAYLLLPTCTITSIASGSTSVSSQTLPSSATALLTIQLVPDQEPEDIYKKVRKHLDEQGFQDVYVKALVRRSPQHSALHDKFVRIVYESTSALYGEDVRVLPLMPSLEAYYPFQSLLRIPVVYTHLHYTEYQLYEHDTVVDEAKQFLTNGVKHLAMIIEGMVYAIDTTG